MKNCYGVKLVDGRVKIFDLAQKEYLKNNGEHIWDYDEGEFWNFFCKKIAYDGEKLSLLILTDQSDFHIPSSIQLHQENKITQEDYRNFIVNIEGIHIITMPHIAFSTKPFNKKRKACKETKEDILKISSHNIAVTYYQEKTTKYERDQE